MSITTITDPTEARTTLWGLIKDIRFAMFTTRDDHGHLQARPMTTRNSSLDEDSNLWFFMSRRGGPVAELGAEASVGVTYAEPEQDSYVSVSGTATVVDDIAKKRRLWTQLDQAWFPGGVADPELALVRVKIAHASYWDVRQSKIVQLYQMARAAITGKQPTELGEHARIEMN